MDIGRVVAERYEILGLVAEGGTGTVWRAVDREAGGHVAIKSVSLERHGWRAEVRDRLAREAELLAGIDDENVVRLHASGETDDGVLYVVLELLRGETLAERRIRPPPLGWSEALGIARGITRGLAALHARGIVHRDVKPANVILDVGEAETGAPVPKLIDLGISRSRGGGGALSHHTLTATGEVLGTPAYMSLEQARGEADIDPRSDVWSLGVVMFEMLSGRLPFEGANVNAILAAVRRGDRPRLQDVAPRVPRPVCKIVERCLAKDRSERYADASALATALDAAVARSRALRARVIFAVASGLLAIAVVVATMDPWARSDVVAGAESAVVPPVALPDPTSLRLSEPPSPALPSSPVEAPVVEAAEALGAPAASSPTRPSPTPTPVEAPPLSPAPSPPPVTKVDHPGF